jgi:hypothetical protein
MITLFFAVLLAAFSGLGGSTRSGPQINLGASGGQLTPADLARMDKCQLDTLFSQGKLGSPPCGGGRGKVLLVVDARMPRVRARLKGSVWKGKVFDPCSSTITNQWLGFKAVKAPVSVGPSWADGAPCFVLDYPTTAAVFGNTRDELREIGEGVFLGRFYDRCPCPKLRGYFVLDFRQKCGCR